VKILAAIRAAAAEIRGNAPVEPTRG
jgi:hypothetical protein